MTFLLSRSPSSSESAGQQQEQVDADVARVQRINVTMEALGVSPSRASTQLYSHPEAVHRLSAQDLLYLAQNADLLANHKDVKCDFKAFSLILWAFLGKLDSLLDEVFMKMTAAAASPSATGRQSVITSRDLHADLYGMLVQANRLTRVLRAFEEPVAQDVTKERLHVTPGDVQVATRLTEKLAIIMQDLTSTSMPEGRASLSIFSRYDERGHTLLKVCEQNISSLWLLLGALVGRPEVDIVPVLNVFNDERQWVTSGCCLLSTESYCRAVAVIAQRLFTRRADFENGDDVAAALVFRRVAKRPPFRWDVFKLLHYTPALYKAVDSVEMPFHCSFALLLQFATLKQTMESFLTIEGATLDATLAAGRTTDEQALKGAIGKRLMAVKRTRKALSRHLSALDDDSGANSHLTDGKKANDHASSSTVLGFGQLLVLAMVSGMPEVELTDDAGLVKRATATKLVAFTDPAVAEVLKPQLLRLLMAYAYTVPTSDDEVEHAALSHKSTIALYRSVSLYFFQEGQYQTALQSVNGTAATPMVNPMCASPILRSYLFLELLVRSTCDSSALQGPTVDTAGAVVCANDEKKRDRDGSTAVAMLHLMKATIDTLYESNDRMYESAMALPGGRSAFTRVQGGASTVFSTVPEQVNVVTALSATLLFFFFNNPKFLKEVHLRTALDTMAHMFALRAVTSAPRNATDQQRKARQTVLQRMQRRLAFIPQRMCAADLAATLLERLVPLSHPSKVSHPNRLRLALLEAYLRSLSSSVAAFAMPDDLMLTHWVSVGLPCMTSTYSAALCVAGHDFFIAPFIAQKTISPLFVATYIAVTIPTGVGSGDASGRNDSFALAPGKYGEPSLPLVKRLGMTVRATCQGLEKCDGTALQQMLYDDKSALSRFLSAGSSGYAATACATAVGKLSPTNAVLLIVSALFDKLCMLWNTSPGAVRDGQQRFATYFSGLVNLLQCNNTQVLLRVCASIEALMVEHMRGSGAVQMEFLKYIGLVVDNVRGNSKKGVAEWFLLLSDKMHKETKLTPSKL